MTSPKKLKNGCPLCWHCLNRLVFQKGGGFKFALVRDQLGTEHRVHLDCLARAVGDGVKEVAA